MDGWRHGFSGKHHPSSPAHLLESPKAPLNVSFVRSEARVIEGHQGTTSQARLVRQLNPTGHLCIPPDPKLLSSNSIPFKGTSYYTKALLTALQDQQQLFVFARPSQPHPVKVSPIYPSSQSSPMLLRHSPGFHEPCLSVPQLCLCPRPRIPARRPLYSQLSFLF